MSSPASSYRSKLARPVPESFRKGRVNASELWAKAILTAPFPDLAGDVVVPTGINWTEHELDPFVDLEHGRDPHVKGMPVAWARESLSEDGAPYSREWAKLNFGGDGEPDDWQTVPVVTYYFDKSCRVSNQVFAMVESDALPAVSIEFKPIHGFYKSLGKSPLVARDAYQFARSELVRYSICAKGVCPHATTLQKGIDPNPTQVPALDRIIADRRVNVGGTWEPLHGVILKALATEAPKRTTVKAWSDTAHHVHRNHGQFASTGARTDNMEPDNSDLDTAGSEALDGAAPQPAPEDTGVAHNGVTALYNHAQGILDLCDQLEADLETTDSPELFKEGKKLCDMARALAEKAKASGDKHDAKLQAMKGSGGEEAEPEEGAEEEADEPPDMEQDDDDGVLKAIRPVYRKAIKRFKLADIQKAQGAVTPAAKPVAPPVEDNDPEFAALSAEFAKWQKYAGVS